MIRLPTSKVQRNFEKFSITKKLNSLYLLYLSDSHCT